MPAESALRNEGVFREGDSCENSKVALNHHRPAAPEEEEEVEATFVDPLEDSHRERNSQQKKKENFLKATDYDSYFSSSFTINSVQGDWYSATYTRSGLVPLLHCP